MKIKLVLIFAFFSIQFLKAQNSNPLDEKYTPPRSSVFGSSQKNLNISDNENDSPCHAIKIPVLEILRGEFRILYEQRIINRLTAEVGIGMPVAGNFVNKAIAGIWFGLWGDPDPDYRDYGDTRVALKTMLDNSVFDSGYLFSFGLRYYFPMGNNAPSYIDITYKNVAQNFFIVNSSFLKSTFSYNNKFITVNLGYSWASGNSTIKFIHNLGFGLGAKWGKWDEFIATVPNLVSPKFNTTGNKKSNIVPILSIKYNIGLNW
ncbi:MAG: hypothetical protein WCP69_08175 [Bacteroidota bacterium]